MKEEHMILADDYGIFQACEDGNLEIVEKFFRAGISVHSESDHNPSLIGIAAFRKNKPLIELMLRYGLDITRPHNRFGSSVAEFAIKRDSVEELEYFLKLGVAIDAEERFSTLIES